jgi:NAD(P)-dependent dehydrogenase (short-subunit alcohol dehydrogenase family)
MNPFAQCTEEDVGNHYAINYKSTFLMTPAAVPHIPQGGSIVFISTSLNTSSMVSRISVGALRAGLAGHQRDMADGGVASIRSASHMCCTARPRGLSSNWHASYLRHVSHRRCRPAGQTIRLLLTLALNQSEARSMASASIP